MSIDGFRAQSKACRLAPSRQSTRRHILIAGGDRFAVGRISQGRELIAGNRRFGDASRCRLEEAFDWYSPPPAMNLPSGDDLASVISARWQHRKNLILARQRKGRRAKRDTMTDVIFYRGGSAQKKRLFWHELQ